jgi:hypothetical protein
LLTDKQIETYSMQVVYPTNPHQRAHALDALVLHLEAIEELPRGAAEDEKDDHAMAFATRRVRPWAARTR